MSKNARDFEELEANQYVPLTFVDFRLTDVVVSYSVSLAIEVWSVEVH